MNADEKRCNLELRLKCVTPLGVCPSGNRFGQTILSHQYTAYPLRVSPVFYLDDADFQRAYLYVMSTSPGLLAQDKLNISLQLADHTSVYLTEQAATKVHSMPIAGSKATTNYEIEIGEGATLEFVPEPLILFADASLEQTINIKIHPTGRLFLSEMILPGRLARGEFYQFQYYFSRLQVTSTCGELWFTDAMRLEGKRNPFTKTNLFASSPVLGNVIIVLPETNLELLSKSVEDLEAANCSGLTVASSILPRNKGLLIRAMASGTHELKNYLKYALNCVRSSIHQPSLPNDL
ncbi:MAG: urease accessory protein UreD [Brasilonema angustatum HA4187-MV1]|jgi:urease accessory protein|nr:urease accessory protein UreD [Brasilonema angustatum HA4187-MV1]